MASHKINAGTVLRPWSTVNHQLAILMYFKYISAESLIKFMHCEAFILFYIKK